jgi:hypothetical protein
MTEDSGAFKTNPRNPVQYGHFVMARHAAAKMSHGLRNSVYVPEVINRPHFVTNTLQALRYSRIGLIRARDTGSPRVVTAFPLHQDSPAEGGTAPMLPGLRFLFAAIVLATSLLIFGLGAAALLRAAHEEFASIPARRAPPEPQFAQQPDTQPVLAMVRVEPQPPADKVTADSPPPPTSAAPEPPAPAAEVPPPAEPEKLAAVKTDDPAPAVEPKSDTAATGTLAPAQATETPAPAQAGEAPAQTPTAAASPVPQPTPPVIDAVPPPTEVKVAAMADPVPAAAAPTPVMVAPEPPPPSPEAIAAARKIATLGGPEVVVEPAPKAVAKKSKVEEKKKPEGSESKRTARKKERRRVTRARPARQAVVQQLDPFGQPTMVPATTRR